MSKKKKKKKNNQLDKIVNSNIFKGIAIILVVVIGFFFIKGNPADAKVYVDNMSHDWGEIDINGGIVSREFTVRNDGTDPLFISRIETSCMCTNAQLTTKEETGPMFSMPHGYNPDASWSGKIMPGEEATLSVFFDPMYHGPQGTGSILRTVKMSTNDPENKFIEFKLTGDVIP